MSTSRLQRMAQRGQWNKIETRLQRMTWHDCLDELADLGHNVPPSASRPELVARIRSALTRTA